MTAIAVRRIQPADAAVLRLVRLRALATDPASFGSTHEREAAYTEERWREWAAGDSDGAEMATLLALRRDEALGIVVARRDGDEPQVFDVFSMWVAPEARRQGVGGRLLEAIEDWIRDSGGAIVRLSVTNTSAAAQRLYEEAGFEPDGTRLSSRHTAGLVEIGLRKSLSR